MDHLADIAAELRQVGSFRVCLEKTKEPIQSRLRHISSNNRWEIWVGGEKGNRIVPTVLYRVQSTE